ncbi:chloride channel protein [Bifidobacterium gallicum]|uniref:Chloride transporter, ClC family n=1 Tax=Bifidobacterium gallicum DSM 20093 = LMG 11596 TaxID=561180 RepID=D1NS75_9BIFI|nr:chloride channel protein [Bifidobacterium gallicum]EFA23527.1 chloride transporter, ClC family [Bifidobacterium gallicum DSM 20093 = LMG 11596]KFI58603.1 chloride transporter, chloride channel family [Bifidobacterium gallicum DSM 20093 = LMG 11596]
MAKLNTTADGTVLQAKRAPHPAINWNQAMRHMAFAIVCGLVCGFGSIVLCLCVQWAHTIFQHHHWLIWTLPAMGVLEILLYQWWKIPANTTTESVIDRIRTGKPITILLAPAIILSTAMSIFSGGSVGKEAGALQLGGSLGYTVGKPFHLRNVFYEREDGAMFTNRYTAATGMAAAFSALFFSPLGSLMFIYELLHFQCLRYVASMLVACFVAYFVARTFGIGDIITKVAIPHIDWQIIGFCIIIGVACALGGSIFSFFVRLLHEITERISTRYWIWTIIGGAIVTALVISCDWWKFSGTGGELLNEALATSNVSWDFAPKMVLSILCLGMWFKGGEIMVSLCMGGLLGSACSVMTGCDPLLGAALGAMCFFAAFDRCPLAAFLMGCEIFGWGMWALLAISVFVAFLFSYPVGMYGAGIRLLVSSGPQRVHSTFADLTQQDNAVANKGPIAMMDEIAHGVQAVMDTSSDTAVQAEQHEEHTDLTASSDDATVPQHQA